MKRRMHAPFRTVLFQSIAQRRRTIDDSFMLELHDRVHEARDCHQRESLSIAIKTFSSSAGARKLAKAIKKQIKIKNKNKDSALNNLIIGQQNNRIQSLEEQLAIVVSRLDDLASSIRNT
mgnify:CR=1 FL=1